MEENIYAAPKADLTGAHIDNGELELASRGARLGAVTIDGLISLFVLLPIMHFSGSLNRAFEGIKPDFGETLLWTLAGWSLFLIIHGFLLNNYGQTVGKRLLGIKIVNLEDEVPAFVPMLGKRYVIFWVLNLIPVLGSSLSFIDALFIFGPDKRCIHDMIASTRVVVAK